MPSLPSERRPWFASLAAVCLTLAGCTSGDSDAADTSTTVGDAVSASSDAGIDVAFVNWYNSVTAGDTSPPSCDDVAPIWVASDSIAPSASGPLMVCADRTPADALVVRLVNNASGPLTVTYPDAAAHWSVEAADDESYPLPGDTGVVVRPGAEIALTADVGTWSAQELTVDFLDRWTAIEATTVVMNALDLDATFEWAETVAEQCEVDSLADADRGAPLAAAIDSYLGCVLDELGDAADEADREALAEISPLMVQLVEQARNVATQQEAGSVSSELVIVAEAPDPAGPSIADSAPPTTAAPKTTTTRVQTTQAPATQAPTTQAPATTVPTTAPLPTKVPTTAGESDLTVPLPPAPVLVALQTVDGGVETYTSWPAVEPTLGLIPGGQIVVIECKAFGSPDVEGGNGWWYRIGSGAATGGWASAVGFNNLVSDVSAGATSADNVNETVVSCS